MKTFNSSFILAYTHFQLKFELLKIICIIISDGLKLDSSSLLSLPFCLNRTGLKENDAQGLIRVDINCY